MPFMLSLWFASFFIWRKWWHSYSVTTRQKETQVNIKRKKLKDKPCTVGAANRVSLICSKNNNKTSQVSLAIVVDSWANFWTALKTCKHNLIWLELWSCLYKRKHTTYTFIKTNCKSTGEICFKWNRDILLDCFATLMRTFF